MLQLFRSFQWLGALVLLALALVIRSAFWIDASTVGSEVQLGPWGQLLHFENLNSFGPWVTSVVVLTLIAFVASFTLQYHRLGSAGTIPGLMILLLGSGLQWWTGYNPYLFGTLCLALAAQLLFAGYRYQGDALPVFDCGVLVGAAWLVAPGFLWFGLWAAIALTQLRKFRLSELLNLLLGIAALPFIAGVVAFLRENYAEFSAQLFGGIVQLPDIVAIGEGWVSLTVLALISGAAIGALRLLTTRRPIQEQRASQMWYTMLAVGWIALLFSATPITQAVAFIVYPAGVLLGIWISELKRERANLIVLIGVGLFSGGFLWTMLT